MDKIDAHTDGKREEPFPTTQLHAPAIKRVDCILEGRRTRVITRLPVAGHLHRRAGRHVAQLGGLQHAVNDESAIKTRAQLTCAMHQIGHAHLSGLRRNHIQQKFIMEVQQTGMYMAWPWALPRGAPNHRPACYTTLDIRARQKGLSGLQDKTQPQKGGFFEISKKTFAPNMIRVNLIHSRNGKM